MKAYLNQRNLLYLAGLLILISSLFFVFSEALSQQDIVYRINKDDTLFISVWRQPDLSLEVIVRPDGMISFPLIGDIEAVGKTLTQLDQEITEKLSTYVREPQVSVMVKKFGGNRVIVLGDVAKPGVYTYANEIRIVEALALAGDCTKFAVKNNVLVIRGDIHNNPQVIKANLIRFIKYADLSQNIPIQPQDIVFVPRTLVGNINAFLETLGPIIDNVYKANSFGNNND
jgi:polysaccharide export outer membrane protein